MLHSNKMSCIIAQLRNIVYTLAIGYLLRKFRHYFYGTFQDSRRHKLFIHLEDRCNQIDIDNRRVKVQITLYKSSNHTINDFKYGPEERSKTHEPSTNNAKRRIYVTLKELYILRSVARQQYRDPFILYRKEIHLAKRSDTIYRWRLL